MAGSARPRATIVLSGLAASAALALAVGLTHTADATHALLVGLVGATATLVADGLRRAQDRFRLRDMVESADWLPGAVASLAASSRQIVDRYAEPEIVDEARRRVRAFTAEFEELARGRIVRPPDDYDLLLAGTRACHRRLSAITTVPAGPGGVRWWRSAAGRRYWRANLDALSRGVAVTRIFVCASVDPDLAELVTEQSRAGVRTMVAPRETLSSGLLPPSLVIWDGRRAWQGWVSAPGGDGAGSSPGNVFTVEEQDLRRLRAAFAACAGAARSVEE